MASHLLAALLARIPFSRFIRVPLHASFCTVPPWTTEATTGVTGAPILVIYIFLIAVRNTVLDFVATVRLGLRFREIITAESNGINDTNRKIV